MPKLSAMYLLSPVGWANKEMNSDHFLLYYLVMYSLPAVLSHLSELRAQDGT